MVIYFFSMYPAIILPIVAVCGFEFPIILAPTIEGEAEAVKITKEKRREDRGRNGYTDSAHDNSRQISTTITPSKLLTETPVTPPYCSKSYIITKQQRLSHS